MAADDLLTYPPAQGGVLLPTAGTAWGNSSWANVNLGGFSTPVAIYGVVFTDVDQGASGTLRENIIEIGIGTGQTGTPTTTIAQIPWTHLRVSIADYMWPGPATMSIPFSEPVIVPAGMDIYARMLQNLASANNFNGFKILYRELALTSSDTSGPTTEKTSITSTVTAIGAASTNSDASGTSSAISVAAPDGLAVGDCVLVFLHVNGQTTIGDNNGATAFTKLLISGDDAAGNYKPNPIGAQTAAVFRRYIQAGDPTTYNFTATAAGRWSAIAVAIRDPAPTNPLDVAPTGGNNADSGVTSGSAAGITTLTANAVDFAVLMTDGGTDLSPHTDPAGYTLIASTPDTAQPIRVTTKKIAAAGATGARSFSWTAPQSYMALSLAVKDNVSTSTPISGSDANGSTTENPVETAALPSSDANSTTTEATTEVVAESASDANSTTTEVGAISQTTTDSSGATTESALVVAQTTATDQNGAVTEGFLIGIATADANGVTTEAVVEKVVESASDANGTVTEVGNVAVPINGGVDTNGTTTENAVEAVATSATDSGSETDTQVEIAIIQASADTATSSEATTEIYGATSADSNTSSESANETASTPSAEAGSGSEIIGMFARQVTDSNGVTSESQSAGLFLVVSDTNTAISENATEVARNSDTEAGTVADVATPKAVETATDSGSDSEAVPGIRIVGPTDQGSSSESNVTQAQIGSPDTGSSSESGSPGNRTSTADVGTDVEFQIFAVAATSGDAGSDIENAVVSQSFVSSDFSSSTEGAVISRATFIVSDFGTGTEFQAATQAHATGAQHLLQSATLGLPVTLQVQLGGMRYQISTEMETATLRAATSEARLKTVNKPLEIPHLGSVM